MISINERSLFGSKYLFLSDICIILCQQLSLFRRPLFQKRKSVFIKMKIWVQEQAFMFQLSESNKISHCQVRSNLSLCSFRKKMFYVDINALGTLASWNIFFVFSPKPVPKRFIESFIIYSCAIVNSTAGKSFAV